MKELCAMAQMPMVMDERDRGEPVEKGSHENPDEGNRTFTDV
jgi:hypothetical protein